MLHKKILIAAALAGFAALSFSTASNAALPGFYVGGQLGYAHTNWSNSNLNGVASSNINNNGFAWRPYVGYQFDDNWGAEIGYTSFPNVKYKQVVIPGVAGVSSTTVKQYAVDALGKGILPLGNCFGMYGKLGLAYVNASTSGSASINGSSSKINPAFGVGVSYDITPNVPVDVSWTRIQKWGGGVPSTDFFALGIQYNFG